MRTKRGCHRAAFFVSIASLKHKNPHHPGCYQGTKSPKIQIQTRHEKLQNSKPNKHKKSP
ncbi:hypothetical protein, partial [Anaerobiospirillum succiniciproducens]|uniref:hypothetical protein n=1 Tax=Anaerobiospirillum succiniciproducens TaxID=13335 RepID=UPI00294239C5